MSRLVRQQLVKSQSEGKQRFLKHAGAIKGGPPDLSSPQGVLPLMTAIMGMDFLVREATNEQSPDLSVGI